MTNEEDYKITLRRDSLLGFWNWTAKTPDGRVLRDPFGSATLSKEAAEARAMHAIKRDRATETISGEELARRVESRVKTEL